MAAFLSFKNHDCKFGAYGMHYYFLHTVLFFSVSNEYEAGFFPDTNSPTATQPSQLFIQ
jgi:hypothetical protein